MFVHACVKVNVYKDPVTDHGKISKKGLMTLKLDNSGKYVAKTEGTADLAKVGGTVCSVINDASMW